METQVPYGALFAVLIWAVVYGLHRLRGPSAPDQRVAGSDFRFAGYDPVLGKIEYAENTRALKVVISLEGQPVEVVLFDAPPTADSLNAACAIAAKLDWLSRHGREAAVRDLLELANREWRKRGTPPYAASTFRERLTLAQVTAWADWTFSLFFEGGELFRGHAVQVNVKLPEGPTSAHVVT